MDFILEGAVDFSSGAARIGKTHIITPLKTLNETHCAKRISKMRDTNRITLVTKELVSALLNEGLSIEEITEKLGCSKDTITRRLITFKEK